MCKFNNRLFAFALYSLLFRVCVLAKTLQDSVRTTSEFVDALMSFAALPVPQDEHYDQRQKGEENYRINVNDFVVALPQDDSSVLQLLTDDMFESLDDDNLLAFGKHNPAALTPLTSSPSSSASVNTPSASESNKNLSSNSDAMAYNIPPMLVEIPASRKYLEARHSVDAVSRTKSYISNFLNVLKRVRKH